MTWTVNVAEPDLPIPSHFERILDAARIAPSLDNLQPWRFVVEGDTISFLVDHERDRTSPISGGRMARIAVGAALECALLRAGRMGATVRFETPRNNALVTISVSAPKRIPEPDKALLRRTTNRQLYDGRPLDDATFTWLHEATPLLEGVRTLWFGRERVRVLGPIVEQGEALFFGEPRAREAALKAIHFDVRDREEVAQGMSLGCLELSSTERMTVDSLRHLPQDRLAAMGAFAKMGARARRLVESASGVCVVTAPGPEPGADVTVGRCMQHAWLALTRKGLVAHPLMAIPVLETMLEAEAGSEALVDRERCQAAVESLRAAFPSVERGSRLAVLMRVGWAAAPTSRVRRLPLEDSMAVAPGT
jgi:sulfur-carrier protein adenylyltransferase/sulfurtransferase